MNSMLLFCILCCTALILAVLRYLRSSLSIHQKWVFITLRFLLIASVLVCFFEPVITFQRITPLKKPIPVLIDNSQSMSLFKPESTVLPVVTRLLEKNKTDKKKSLFEFFIFGKSFKRISDITEISFSDSVSYFPSFDNKQLDGAQSLLIISDANWMNQSLPLERLIEKPTCYIRLPDAQMRPNLRFSIIAPPSISADSNAAVTASVQGFADKKGTLILTLFENKAIVTTKSISMDSGVIQLGQSLPLGKLAPGKHLFRIVADYQENNLHTEGFCFIHSQPSNFTYSAHSSKSTLDKRFFSLALQRHPELVPVSPSSKSPDLIILYDNEDQTGQFKVKTSADHLLLFLGCGPCDSEMITFTTGIKLFRPVGSSDVFIDNMVLSELPPPSAYKICKKPSAILQHISGMNGNDTVPILFTGTYQNNQYLALAAIDFWKWDFWPLSVSHGEDLAFGFSERLISMVKDMLLRKIAGGFYAFPEEKIHSTDSIRFSLSLPSELPANSELKISLVIKQLNKNVFETNGTIITTGSLFQPYRIPPLAPGKYEYYFDVDSKAPVSNHYNYSDTLFVDKNDNEFMVLNQNVLLLNEFGRVVDLTHNDSLSRYVAASTSITPPPSQERFQITRSWGILIFIFALFTIEFILRRRYNLD